MQNLTLISLYSISLLDSSPLYSLNTNTYRKFSFLYNSYFSHSFANIIFTTTEYHTTSIKNSIFSKFLSTPLVFSKDFSSGVCRKGSYCCVSKDFEFEPNKTIQHLIITNESFPEIFANKNVFFENNCGDIQIYNCRFLNCSSTYTSGGGIRIEQLCKSEIISCIFYGCISLENGGAIAFAKEITIINSDRDHIPNHIKSIKIDLNYSCFYNCFIQRKRGYGASLIAGAKEININYCSTSYSSYPEEYRALGATYDLLGDSISTKYINCTNGLSIYCASIEYRKTSVSQTFAFHEILGVSGKYIMTFSSYLNMSNNSHFEMCNIINNTMIDNNNRYVRPTIIFYQISNFIINNFTFIRNDFGEMGMIASVDYRDKMCNITFINCVASFCPIQAWEANHITTIDCIIADKYFETIDLNLHNLVDCRNAFPTDNFSDSLDFTQSYEFSDSMAYTPSCVFTPSLFIGQTHFFTPSNTFTPSFDFTHSKSYLFSCSHHFTHSLYFSNSDHFTDSNSLTEIKYSSHFTMLSFWSNSFVFASSLTLSKKPSSSSSKSGFRASNMLSYSYSFTLVKSVSFSFSYILSNVYSLTYVEGLDDYSYILVPSHVERNFPYIIQFFSPTLVKALFLYEIKIEKKGLSSIQLIGIVCGSVGVFFAIIGIIVLSLKRKYSVNFTDFIDYSDDDEYNMEMKETITTTTGSGIEQANTTTNKSIGVIKETEVNFNISEINKNDIDDWL